uniref:Uncharacterized protein n=1 Tax=Cacopsylla melanoneura TaxID=428564 RepID=A0A8D8VVE5_9HEMI
MRYWGNSKKEDSASSWALRRSNFQSLTKNLLVSGLEVLNVLRANIQLTTTQLVKVHQQRDLNIIRIQELWCYRNKIVNLTRLGDSYDNNQNLFWARYLTRAQ